MLDDITSMQIHDDVRYNLQKRKKKSYTYLTCISRDTKYRAEIIYLIGDTTTTALGGIENTRYTIIVTEASMLYRDVLA
jgi:hypothetical protein